MFGFSPPPCSTGLHTTLELFPDLNQSRGLRRQSAECSGDVNSRHDPHYRPRISAPRGDTIGAKGVRTLSSGGIQGGLTAGITASPVS